MNESDVFDIIVCGAGPAGLTAAVSAALSGKKVAVFERMPKPGRKLLVTGGGRCNITKREQLTKFLRSFDDKEMFVKPSLKQFSQESLIRLFENHGLALHTSETLQVYPESHKSIDVLNCLLQLAEDNKVELFTDCNIDKINIDNGSVTGVTCHNGNTYESEAVIVAAGGMSYPALGADGRGYGLAQSAGHSIITPVPALAGLVSKEKWPAQCSGLSIDPVVVYVDTKQFRSIKKRGSVLFTHKGVSGPAVLDLSRYVSRLLQKEKSVKIRIKPLPEMSREHIDDLFVKVQQKCGSKRLRFVLADLLPSRFVNQLMVLADTDPEIRAADVNKQHKLRFLDLLDNGVPLDVIATEQFDNSMVTSGGVSCDEINPQTMESLKTDGLFFCGEVIDVDGPCGGYNLQWAFSSGFCAGKSAAIKINNLPIGRCQDN